MVSATLTIHLHEAEERDEQGLVILEQLVDKEHPIALACGVDNIEAWQGNRKFYDYMKYIIGAQNVSLVQRGYRNRCFNEHTIRDPHHENVCSKLMSTNVGKGMRSLGNGMASIGEGMVSIAGMRRRSLERVMGSMDNFANAFMNVMSRQSLFMTVGKEQITEAMGKEPVAYCPPNSLYNRMTMHVAKDLLGYTHFTVPSILPAFPYTAKNHTVIVPQTALARFGIGHHAYAHLDQLPELNKKGKVEQHLEQGLMPLTAVEKEPWLGCRALNQAFLVPANRVLHYGYIQMRDARRAMRYLLRKTSAAAPEQ